ncbi:hypothetical protein FC777_02455 [Clostridium botulinum]|nr:hypothetical protein [Clostridium botulinum]
MFTTFFNPNKLLKLLFYIPLNIRDFLLLRNNFFIFFYFLILCIRFSWFYFYWFFLFNHSVFLYC